MREHFVARPERGVVVLGGEPREQRIERDGALAACGSRGGEREQLLVRVVRDATPRLLRDRGLEVERVARFEQPQQRHLTAFVVSRGEELGEPARVRVGRRDARERVERRAHGAPERERNAAARRARRVDLVHVRGRRERRGVRRERRETFGALRERCAVDRAERCDEPFDAGARLRIDAVRARRQRRALIARQRYAQLGDQDAELDQLPHELEHGVVRRGEQRADAPRQVAAGDRLARLLERDAHGGRVVQRGRRRRGRRRFVPAHLGARGVEHFEPVAHHERVACRAQPQRSDRAGPAFELRRSLVHPLGVQARARHDLRAERQRLAAVAQLAQADGGARGERRRAHRAPRQIRERGTNAAPVVAARIGEPAVDADAERARREPEHVVRVAALREQREQRALEIGCGVELGEAARGERGNAHAHRAFQPELVASRAGGARRCDQAGTAVRAPSSTAARAAPPCVASTIPRMNWS